MRYPTWLLVLGLAGCGPDDEAPPVDADGDGVPLPEDCDDDDDAVFPGNDEVVCDGVDNDCDAATPDAGLRVPGDAASVQEALDLAVDGDIVCVDPGEWGPAVITRPVALVSTGGSAVTTLDAGGAGSVVAVAASGVTVAGFTLANGAHAEGYGHGVRVEGASAVVLSDLAVEAPPSGWAGGGVYALGLTGSTWDASVEITANVAVDGEGGGVLCEICDGNPATADVHDNSPDDIACVSEPRCTSR